MKIRTSKALVTGGAGFIGSHLTELLLAEGYSVIVLDNFSTGRESNLVRVENHPKLTIHLKDVSNYQNIIQYFKDVEWVFHLAGLADIVPSIEHPLDYYRANVNGTMNVLEAARHAGVKRFIYTASSTCYGIPDQYPTPETAAIQPMFPYAFTKYLGEQCTLYWDKIYKLPCVSLRLFNVYGPRSRTSGTYGAVFGVFLAQKLAGKPYTIVGDGSQTRDFTFVSDVADAFLTAAQSDVVQEGFNVGSGGTYSINHLVSLLGGKAVHIPKRPGEPDCTFADISKISKRLGWRSKISFEEGVKEMIKHQEDWRSAPVWDEQSIAAATKEWFTHLS